MAKAHYYKITPKDPGAHIFEVTVTVEKPDPNGQVFSMPAWVPGSYMIRDLARHVVSIRAQANGADIGLEKIDKSSWRTEASKSAITLTAEIFAYDLNVRGAHLDTTHGFFDGACVFPAVSGQQDLPCELEIRPPPADDDWRVVTSMRSRTAEKYGFGKFTAEDYAELIDHPVEMGKLQIAEFEVSDIPHIFAVRGHVHFDIARVCHDLATVCTYQLQLMGKPKGFDRYVFLLYVQEKAYGGLEHRWSSSLACSRRDLPGRGESGVSARYQKFLGLCSHEYFHLWNVKRIKPEKFELFDLSREVHTGLLWVFEGVTSYYDHLTLVRAGLVSRERYLEHLGRAITRLNRSRGRLRQTLEQASFDSWTHFYQASVNASNATVSYYTKGSLVALALDLTIRKDTQGEKSLDDVIRKCWSLYGETGKGMPERGFEAVARSVSGLELADFFERFVRGTTELPLQGLLRDFGINLHMRPAGNSDDVGGKPSANDAPPPPWIGAQFEEREGKSTVALVHTGSPAEKAGLAPGDIAVALDDLRLGTDNVDLRLREHHVGDTVTVSAFRDEHLMKFAVKLAAPPEDTCYLAFDDKADAGSKKLREAWLGQ
ncbi:MAG: PDZ domain-containing protein [Woeseiaceae bacterium]|nr:PDZ domain-containing protein [Woeseiaceae bacterium]